MAYEYRVVPFLPAVNASDPKRGEKVADALYEIIHTHAERGWDFYRIDQVQLIAQPGCLAALFGGRSTMEALDQVIFRRETSTEPREHAE